MTESTLDKAQQDAQEALQVGLMKYQYEQIIKQLLLLQDHAAARTCPYSPAGEACIRKHLMAIEAYAEETIPMEEDSFFNQKLQTLESEAMNYRLDYEAALCGERTQFLEGLERWARDKRKEFEKHALICQLRVHQVEV
jgi:hypothetical protein